MPTCHAIAMFLLNVSYFVGLIICFYFPFSTASVNMNIIISSGLNPA